MAVRNASHMATAAASSMMINFSFCRDRSTAKKTVKLGIIEEGSSIQGI